MTSLPFSPSGSRLVSIGSGGTTDLPSVTGEPTSWPGLSITTSWVETNEFITGRRGVAPGHNRLGFKIGPKLLIISVEGDAAVAGTSATAVVVAEIAAATPATEGVSTTAAASFGLGGLELTTEDNGSSELILEVVVVEVRHVFTLGCNIPVGFRPTCGLVIGPHTGRDLVNSTIHSEMASFNAILG